MALTRRRQAAGLAASCRTTGLLCLIATMSCCVLSTTATKGKGFADQATAGSSEAQHSVGPLLGIQHSRGLHGARTHSRALQFNHFGRIWNEMDPTRPHRERRRREQEARQRHMERSHHLERTYGRNPRLVGVQLDATETLGGGGGGKRRLHMATAAPTISTDLQRFRTQLSKYFPEGQVVYFARMPRAEAQRIMEEHIGTGKKVPIDLKIVEELDGMDDGDDPTEGSVMHYQGGTINQGGKVVVDSKNFAKASVYLVGKVKGTNSIVDCGLKKQCDVWVGKDSLPDWTPVTRTGPSGRRLTATAINLKNQKASKPDWKKTGLVTKDRNNLLVSEVSFPGTTTAGEMYVEEGSRDAELYVWTFGAEDSASKRTYTLKKPAQRKKCFPASATVVTAEGNRVRVDQLSQGDRVLVVQPGGQLGFSEVYLFGHKDAEAVSRFVAMDTALNSTLLATADHFVHIIPAEVAAASASLHWRDVVHAPAGSVKAGDVLAHVSFDGCPAVAPSGHVGLRDAAACGTTKYVAVTAVRRQLAKGLYNPYTLVGNIVVDGFSASSHSGMGAMLDGLVGTGPNAHKVYQALLAPVRVVYRLYPTLLAHVDDLYSADGWESAGVAKVVRAILEFHGLGK